MTTRLLLLLASMAGLLAAEPATAQSSGNGQANVKVLKPLQLSSLRNLVFGNILLQNFTGTRTVSVMPTGRTCGAQLTCSGLFSTAQFRLNGSNGETALISVAGPVVMTGSQGGTLVVTPSAPASVRLPNSGNPGVTFEVGGSITFSAAQPEGVYSGVLDVLVIYQ